MMHPLALVRSTPFYRQAIGALVVLLGLFALAPPAGAAPDAASPSAPDRTPATPSAPTEKPAPAHPAPSQADIDAYRFQPSVACPMCTQNPAFPNGRYGLHWHDHWRHVGIAEYTSIPLLFGTGLLLSTNLVFPAVQHAKWTGPILFDEPVRDGLELKSSSARSTAALLSNGLLYASIAQANVVDNLLVSWGLRQNPEVAWQMTVINAQAYGLTLATVGLVKRLTARERPFGPVCDADPSAPGCSGDRYTSFFSGHAAMTATTAGLVCAHHTQLHLYEGDVGDAAACVTSLAMMAATSVLRISSENHWASDVLVGDLVGLSSGYLLPTLLYYKQFRLTPAHPEPAAPVVAALPLLGPGTAGLTVAGMF